MTAEAVRAPSEREREAKDHNLVAEHIRVSGGKGVRYEKRPVKAEDGKPVAGLYTPGSRSTIRLNSIPTPPTW